jgi:chromosome partitioning protein
MIITFGNVKGGVGKTTLAVNTVIALASARRDVLLVDGDQQGTALTFAELREEAFGSLDFTAVQLAGNAVRQQVRKLRSKYDDIVIDTGGRDSGSFRAALTVTETLIVPVQPRTFDVWAVDQVAELITEAREINDHLAAYAVLNAADPQGRDNAEAADVLGENTELAMLSTPIVRRKALANACAAGRGIREMSPKDLKAESEFAAFMRQAYLTPETRS